MHGLRSARIFPVLGQILGQGRRTPSGFTPHKTKRRLPSSGEATRTEAGPEKMDHTYLPGKILNVLKYERTRAEEAVLWD